MAKNNQAGMTDEELLGRVIDFRQYRADMEKLRKEKDAVEGEIKSELEVRDIEEITVGVFKVVYRNYTRKVFDRQRFFSENPELYARYVKEQRYKALTVA
ncbi:MAG: hypothetical protein IJ702_04535 [Fretibacterium sp.]|nr:hypothetical protein [Fretibacterium sp.]